jgi:2-dehydropantoate 2-reductase
VLRPVLGAQTAVVPLNNGVEAPAQLSAAIGASHVLGGLCRISALIAAPGYIRHVGIEPYVAFGELDGSHSQRVDRLRQAFERSGVTVETPRDIQAAMWGKFMFIAAISGLGAVTRAPLGVIREVPETRRILADALQEIVNLSQAKGIALPVDAAAQTLTSIDRLPGEVTASMQRDIMDGKPSELDSQNGAVVRMGLESGVPTPTHTFIYHSLLPQERKARGEIDF